jgi:hypothetical protein
LRCHSRAVIDVREGTRKSTQNGRGWRASAARHP